MTTNLHWMECLTHWTERQLTNNHWPFADQVYTFLNNYPSVIVNDVFHRRQNTYLWNFHAFANDVSRNNYLLNSVVYKASQLWRTLSFYLLVLAKIIQEWIEKLVLHWIPMSNLLKRHLLALDPFNSSYQLNKQILLHYHYITIITIESAEKRFVGDFNSNENTYCVFNRCFYSFFSGECF